MPRRKGTRKRKQTICGGGASSPRRSRSKSASPKRSRSISTSPTRSRSKSASPKRSKSRSASNNINNINRSPDYDAPYSYDAIYDILMTFKTNPEKQVTKALRHHINKENLDAFLESIKSKSLFEIEKIHKLVHIPIIEKRINNEEKLSKKEKEEKIKLFRDFESKFKPLENDAFFKYLSDQARIELLRQRSERRRVDWRERRPRRRY